MAVTTQWTITYHCGHVEERDLSEKPAHKRAGFAKWLATKNCTDCWRQTQGLQPRMSTEEWVAAKRAQEDEAAKQWASENGMPELIGSDKAVAWASRVRHQALQSLYTWAVEEDNDPGAFEDVEEIVRSLDRAGWWLDNREHVEDPETLLELLHSAATDDGVICENT